MTHTIFLSLGSNLGDRIANLEASITSLPAGVLVIERSSIYETPPWGYTEQPPFLNMVLKTETNFSPWRLLKNLKSIERKLGRESSFRYGPRLIDLDILFYDQLIYQKDGLFIPHPRIAERAFVLVPLVEITPELLHPQLERTMKDLLGDLDSSGIVEYNPPSQQIESKPSKNI